MKLIGYLGRSLNAIANLDRIDSGVWEEVGPRSPTDMTLVCHDGLSIGRAAATVTAMHAKGKPCLMSLFTPWAQVDPGYNRIFGSATLKAALIRNIVAEVVKYKFDGVDADWESAEPPNVMDLPAYASFMADLKAALPAKQNRLGIAANWKRLSLLPTPLMEYVGIMGYDTGVTSTWFGTMAQLASALNLYTAAGWPKDKLVVGLTAYARKLTDNSWYRAGWNGIVNAYHPADSATSAGGYAFNGIDLAKQKAAYLQANGYGGAFLYSVNVDSPTNSLAAAILGQWTPPPPPPPAPDSITGTISIGGKTYTFRGLVS